MEKMKFLSESIPASSKVFWNRFRIVAPESVSKISSGIGSGILLWNWNWLRNRNRLWNRSQFRHLQKNRRLGPMMLRIDSRKESKFTIHSHGNSRIEFASETSYFNSRIDSHSAANSMSGDNPDSVTGAHCDSQVNSDSGAHSDRAIDWFLWLRLPNRFQHRKRVGTIPSFHHHTAYLETRLERLGNFLQV